MNTQFHTKLLQHLNHKKSQKGFTLIELLVVVIIIGVLAAIALPNLLGQVGKARESEAKSTIGALNRAQQSYFTEKAAFGRSTDELEVPVGNEKYYTFRVAGWLVSPGGNAIKVGGDGIQHAQGIDNPKAGTRDYVGGVNYNTTTRTFATVVCRSTDKARFYRVSTAAAGTAIGNTGALDSSVVPTCNSSASLPLEEIN